MENLIEFLKEDGYTDEEIDQILMDIEDGHTVDSAMQKIDEERF